MHEAITAATSAVNYVNNIPFGAVEAGAAALIISPIVNAIKKWRGWQNEKFILGFTTLVCALIAGGKYLLDVPTHDPSIIALQTAVLSFFSTHAYTYIIKPVWIAVSDKFGAGADLQRQLQSAAVPTGGLPIETPVTPNDAAASALRADPDFS